MIPFISGSTADKTLLRGKTSRRETGRTCLGCRRKRTRDEMVRLVVDPEGKIVIDLLGRLPGRGAYTCPSHSCLTAALQEKKLLRAYRRNVEQPSAEDLLRDLERQLERRILGLLGMARRSGRLAMGREASLEAAGARRAELILMAEDLSVRSRKELEDKAGDIPVVIWGSMRDLGAAVGRPETGVMALTNGPLAAMIGRYFAKLSSLKMDILG